MYRALIGCLLIVSFGVSSDAQEQEATDPWELVRLFEGSWTGSARRVDLEAVQSSAHTVSSWMTHISTRRIFRRIRHRILIQTVRSMSTGVSSVMIAHSGFWC